MGNKRENKFRKLNTKVKYNVDSGKGKKASSRINFR